MGGGECLQTKGYISEEAKNRIIFLPNGRWVYKLEVWGWGELTVGS